MVSQCRKPGDPHDSTGKTPGIGGVRYFGTVRNLAASRREHGIPLKTVSLFLEDAEKLLQTSKGGIEELRSCVGSLEVAGA
jgi:hypothetical protein